MNQLIRKTYQAETKQAEGAERTLIVKISTSSPDRSNDVVLPSGVVLENYLKNPVVAFGHNYSGLSIAKTQEIAITDDGILAKLVFPKAGVYELADTVYELYKDGFMNAWSIGFMPMEYKDRETGGREFTKWELLEYSAVLVPDNPQALTILRTKGIDTDLVDEKEGRVLSGQNRKVVSGALDQLKTAIGALENLLTLSEGEPPTDDKSVKGFPLTDLSLVADQYQHKHKE